MYCRFLKRMFDQRIYHILLQLDNSCNYYMLNREPETTSCIHSLILQFCHIRLARGLARAWPGVGILCVLACVLAGQGPGDGSGSSELILGSFPVKHLKEISKEKR